MKIALRTLWHVHLKNWNIGTFIGTVMYEAKLVTKSDQWLQATLRVEPPSTSCSSVQLHSSVFVALEGEYLPFRCGSNASRSAMENRRKRKADKQASAHTSAAATAHQPASSSNGDRENGGYPDCLSAATLLSAVPYCIQLDTHSLLGGHFAN